MREALLVLGAFQWSPNEVTRETGFGDPQVMAGPPPSSPARPPEPPASAPTQLAANPR